MSIVFTCDFCGKKIEAPDNFAGKQGKCPRCHNKLHVPTQNAEEEEFKLAPIDESDIEKQKRLQAESYNLIKDILSERHSPAETDESAEGPEADISEEKLTINIITYLRLMADGGLDEADRLAKSITPTAQALKILDRIATSEPPEPELADIPEQVLARLIKTLRARIM